MELSLIIPHIEALIFASDKPLTNLDLVELLNNAMGFIDDRATLDQVESSVDGISEKYKTEFYAFELKQSGGGLQFLTKKEYHKTVAQLNGDKFLKRLSNAALETLAIIAYKQPITKSEIESIRGVNCDYAVQKLLEKDLVIIAGRNEEAVGKPLIYATSKSFMDYFGINSTADLPKISEILMDDLVQATIVNNNIQKEQDELTELAVSEEGEIIENVSSLSSFTNEYDETIVNTQAENEELIENNITNLDEFLNEAPEETFTNDSEEVHTITPENEEEIIISKEDSIIVVKEDEVSADNKVIDNTTDKQIKDEEEAES